MAEPRKEWVSREELEGVLAGSGIPSTLVPYTDVGGMTPGSIPFGDATGFQTEDNPNLFWDAAEANLGIGTNTFGATMTQGVQIATGLAPTANVADTFAFYSADFVAGNACPYFRTELGTVIGLNQSLLTTDNVTFVQATITSDLLMTGAGAGKNIKFSGTHGGGGEGITYEDAGGVGRFGLIFPGADIVALANRAANGVVQIRANTGVAGVGGEVIVATFEDTDVTLSNGIGLNLYEDITFLGATTENIIAIPDNLADAFSFKEGANFYMTFVTTNGAEAVSFGQDIFTDRWLNQDSNTFIGVDVCGSDNLAHTAGQEGYHNTGFGYSAFLDITLGYYNCAFGEFALESLTSGIQNCAFGAYALDALTTADNNTAFGTAALASCIGAANLAMGYAPLYSNTTGEKNIGIGNQAAYFTQTGFYNIAIGSEAGYGVLNNSYEHNVIIGAKAGLVLTTGSYNFLMGYQTGDNLTTGARNILIGYDLLASAVDVQYELNIGNSLYGELDTHNIGIATLTFGTNATNIFAQATGVAPTTSPADMFQMYSADIGGVGGKAGAHFRDEEGNVVSIGSGGMLMTGTARITNSIWVDAGGLKAPGAKPATEIPHGILETPAWQFADAIAANQETISFNMRVPNRMDRSVAPTISIGWSADGINPGDCEWQLEYLWTSPGEDTGAAAQETLTATGTAAAVADGLVNTTFAGIDLPSATDVCIHCRITRLSADANDTIADTVELHGICLTWTSNKLGTAT